MKIAIVASLLAMTTAPAAFAEAQKEVTTSKGTTAVLINLISVRADCSLGTVAIPVVKQQPKHGTITMAATMLDVPPTRDCPARKAPVIVVVYAPEIDFIGTDDVAIDLPDAHTPTSFSYRVSVTPNG